MFFLFLLISIDEDPPLSDELSLELLLSSDLTGGIPLLVDAGVAAVTLTGTVVGGTANLLLLLPDFAPRTLALLLAISVE